MKKFVIIVFILIGLGVVYAFFPTSFISLGLHNQEIYDLKFSKQGYLFAINFEKIYKRVNNTWKVIGINKYHKVLIGENNLFATQGSNLYKYSGRDLWEEIGPHLSITMVSNCVIDANDYLWINVKSEFGYNHDRVRETGIYCSKDQGNTWEFIIKTPEEYTSPHFLAIIEANTIIIGVKEGSAQKNMDNPGGCIFRSINGQSWKLICKGYNPTNLVETTKGIFIATDFGDYGVLFSTDKGENWKFIEKFREKRIRKICMNSKDYIFISWKDNIFYSKDYNNWKVIKHNYSIWNFCVNDKGYVFIATDNGVYRSKDSFH